MNGKIIKSRASQIALIFVSVIMISQVCLGGVEAKGHGPTRPSADWVVMIYADGDTNDHCEQYSNEIMDEIESATQFKYIWPVVMIDVTNPWPGSDDNNARYYDLWGGSRDLIEDVGEVNMGDASTLSDFMTWAYSYCKHDTNTKYALIMFDHGHNFGGLCRDYSHGNDWLRIDELRTALESFQNMAGKTLDLVGFDACVMMGAEVMYEIEDQTNVIVGSENIEFGDAWAYDLIFTRLANEMISQGPVEPYEFGRFIVEEYENYWGGAGGPILSKLTLSAYNTSYINDIVDRIASLGFVLEAQSEVYDSEIMLARHNSEEFVGYFIDLINFTDQLETYVPMGRILEAAIDNLRDDIDAALIANFANTGVPGANGMSIYFPEYALLYENMQSDPDYVDYSTITFSTDGAPDWDSFLRTILGVT